MKVFILNIVQCIVYMVIFLFGVYVYFDYNDNIIKICYGYLKKV